MTPRLVYEALSAKHASGLFVALADPRVWEHIEGGSLPATVAALAERFTRVATGPPAGRAGEQWVNYAVALADEPDVPIGRIEATIHAAADKCWAETAYLFNPAHWGHGLASEAMTWLHAELTTRGVHELWVAIAPGNARSLALARRSGIGRRARKRCAVWRPTIPAMSAGGARVARTAASSWVRGGASWTGS